MGNVIAVLSGSKDMYEHFISNVDTDNGDTEYVCILSWDDARGRLFTGHTCLLNWYIMHDADEVLEMVKSRIRKL